MSNHLKSSLLAATAVAIAAATPAYAQLVFPAADLRGAGATSVQDMWPREANCTGGFKFVSTAAGSNSFTVNADDTVSARNLGNAAYAGTPAFNCGTASVQSVIVVHYIGVGSGAGRKILAATDFNTGYAANGIKLPNGTTVAPAIPSAAIFGTTIAAGDNAHYALSDSPLGTASNEQLSTGHAAAKAMIQIPLYVLPVAVAYNPTYAYLDADHTKTLKFNVTGLAATTANGGLRLSKVAYCKIFNGYITNWNAAEIAATNWEVDTKGAPSISKTTKKPILRPLFDATNDTAARWAAEGAPIRLVGRLDKSGTTDIFSRHLNNACTDSLGALNNKYSNAAESLPFDSTSAINLTEFRGDTNYKPAVAASSFAGTTQMLNGVVYKNGIEGFVGQTSGFTASQGVTASATGTNGGAKFIVASGGGNVIAAINAAFASAAGTAKDLFGRDVYSVGGATGITQYYRKLGTAVTVGTVTTVPTSFFAETDDSLYGSADVATDTSTTPATVTTTSTAGADITLLSKVAIAANASIPGALILSAGTVPNPNSTVGTPLPATKLLFNGKVGYISADQVLPAVGAVTSSAALEIGNTYANGTGKKPAFAMANAINAQAAFGKTVLPPETLANGKYSAGSTGSIVRTNPLDWYNALYGAGSSLANPAVGYPMTGTTQFITGTCFADPDVRNAVATFLTTALGKNLVDSKNAKISKTMYTGIKTTDQGIRTQYNIAPMNATWTTAIYNTFLAKVVKDNSLGLYIQDGLPGKIFAGANGLTLGTGVIAESNDATVGAKKLPTGVYYGPKDTVKAKPLTEAAPNPSCVAGTGL